MKFLRFLIASWKHRDTPFAHLVQEAELLQMAGRRCAYDLKHASDQMWYLGNRNPDKTEWRNGQHEFFSERADMWLNIFEINEGGKKYRHRLHDDIRNLSNKVEKLKSLLKENGIVYNDPDDKIF